MAIVSMKQLLEAGVHFGHQTRRWNPKMKPYIFTERNGIYILDLQKTLHLLETAYDFIQGLAAKGGSILFVGTKKQAQEAVAQEAARSEMPFVNHRWLGGMLTNYRTMSGRIARLNELKKMDESGTLDRFPKKEALRLRTEKEKLDKNLGGYQKLARLPDAVYIIDPRKEKIAIDEARRLEIPIIAIVDTNCDPDEVDYVVPGNDDAIRAVTLITKVIADAVVEGREGMAAQAAAAEQAVAAEVEAGAATALAGKAQG